MITVLKCNYIDPREEQRTHGNEDDPLEYLQHSSRPCVFERNPPEAVEPVKEDRHKEEKIERLPKRVRDPLKHKGVGDLLGERKKGTGYFSDSVPQ